MTTPMKNSVPFYEQYLNAKCGSRGIPLIGTFELTASCNFNCKMCYVHKNGYKNELSAEEWIKIGKEAADKGLLYLLLTGGEPLLRKDFKEIYLSLRKLGLLISVNTNGSLIDDEMLEFFKKYPPFRINISLYGCSENTYENLCGVPYFSDVIKNIRKIKEAGLQLKLNCSLTPDNEGDLSALYKTAEDIGLHLKATSYMFPPVRTNGCDYGNSPSRFTAEKAAQIHLACLEHTMTAEEIKNSCREDEIPGLDCSEKPSAMHCRAGKTAFWIKWNGNMIPCGMMPFEGVNVRETGFSEAWEKTKSFAFSLKESGECAVCPYREECPSCAASAIAETGSSDKRPAYICRMIHTLHKLKEDKYKKD